jgi:hypothetical protein
MQLKFVDITVDDQSKALDFTPMFSALRRWPTSLTVIIDGSPSYLPTVSRESNKLLNPLLYPPPRSTKRLALRLESLPWLSPLRTSKRIMTG